MGRRTQGDSGSAAVPPSVDVSKVSEGLGLVAGTCVSTADFANIPEVDARLALAGLSPETDPIQLTSCDNETNILPEQRSLDSLNVKTFLTKPFPAELHGWKDGLTIVRDVLKPVGILFLDDADPIIYTVQSPRRQQDAPTHDVAASLTAQLAWQGDPHLPRIRPCERARCRVHICAHCGAQNEPAEELGCTFGGNAGDTLAFVDFSVGVFIFIFKHLAPALFAKGKLYHEGHLGAADAGNDTGDQMPVFGPRRLCLSADTSLRRRRQSEFASRRSSPHRVLNTCVWDTVPKRVSLAPKYYIVRTSEI